MGIENVSNMYDKTSKYTFQMKYHRVTIITYEYEFGIVKWFLFLTHF